MESDRDNIKAFLDKLSKEKKDFEPTVLKQKKKRFGKKSFFVLSALLVSIFLFGYLGYKISKKVIHIKLDEVDAIISRVSELTELPKDETPTVATVANAEMLKNQSFFKEAQIGDKVLIYDKAKKAVLYRPSTKKVVSIAPLN